MTKKEVRKLVRKELNEILKLNEASINYEEIYDLRTLVELLEKYLKISNYGVENIYNDSKIRGNELYIQTFAYEYAPSGDEGEMDIEDAIKSDEDDFNKGIKKNPSLSFIFKPNVECDGDYFIFPFNK